MQRKCCIKRVASQPTETGARKRAVDAQLAVLEARYLKRDASGHINETPEALFGRVAHHVAQAENKFGDAKAAQQWEEAFFQVMARLDFLPNMSKNIRLRSTSQLRQVEPTRAAIIVNVK